MAALLRAKYPFLPPQLAVDHLVIGAGVVVSPGFLAPTTAETTWLNDWTSLLLLN